MRLESELTGPQQLLLVSNRVCGAIFKVIGTVLKFTVRILAGEANQNKLRGKSANCG